MVIPSHDGIQGEGCPHGPVLQLGVAVCQAESCEVYPPPPTRPVINCRIKSMDSVPQLVHVVLERPVGGDADGVNKALALVSPDIQVVKTDKLPSIICSFLKVKKVRQTKIVIVEGG